MTNEEALKEIGEWYSGFSNKPSEESIKTAIEALYEVIKMFDKQDRYRWHDL